MASEKKEESKDELIQIPKDQLAEMKKSIADMKESQELLMSVASKKGLALYYQRHKDKLPSEVKLRMLDGKVIIGWRMVKDEGSFQDPVTRFWKENQEVELRFEDETTEKMPLMDFNRRYTSVKCRKEGTITDDATGDTALKLVRLDNGKKYTVGVKYVN